MSPQQVDPLGWLSGPYLPLLLASAGALQGFVAITLRWDDWANPLAELLAVPFFLLAGALTSSATRADRPQFGPNRAFPALIISGIGFVLAAFGTAVDVAPPENWWAAVALGITLASFAPFSSARQLLFYAAPTAAFVVLVGGGVYFLHGAGSQPVSVIVVFLGPVAVATVAAVVFSSTTVRRIRRAIALAAAAGASVQGEDPDASLRANATIARIGAQVAPFLRTIADAGAITEADRAVAAQLALQLRADLVTASNLSWLDSVAEESELVVVDPTGLADRMNEAQRSALRGMLLAVMDNPVVDRDSLLIELRAEGDGTTAVAFSFDVDLPEGRRVMLLAPYYLTLKATVDNLSWADGRSMLFRFQIPADD